MEQAGGTDRISSIVTIELTTRRICPGKDCANQALYINITTMLWAFDIGKAKDADGHLITPSRTECVDDGLAVYAIVSLVFVCAR